MSDAGSSGHDAAVLLRMDRAVLGLYHVMRELSFLRGPAGHSLCAPLLRSVTSTSHIDAFMYDCTRQMCLQLDSILRGGSSVLASREPKAHFATLAEFDTLCVPFGLDGRKTVRREDVPCSAPFSAVVPHICLTIDQAAQKCREHGALVPGTHSMEMHSRSLIAISEGYRMVCDRFEEFMREASENRSCIEAAGSVLGDFPTAHGQGHDISGSDRRARSTASTDAGSSNAGHVKGVSTGDSLNESSLVTLCQITVDVSYLGIACRTVGDRLVRRSLKIQDREVLEHVQSIERRLVGIATDAQVRMHEVMCARIDNIMREYLEGEAFDWGTCTLRSQASPELNRITDQVQSWFRLINVLQSSDINLAHFVAFRHICELMMREMEIAGNGGRGAMPSPEKHAGLNKTVKFITMPAISNFSIDLAKLEAFAENSGVHDLKQTLAEPRQLCDLLLSGNIDAITDPQVRQKYYPSVSTRILVKMLRRHEHVSPSFASAAPAASAMRQSKGISRTDARPSVWALMFGKSNVETHDHDHTPSTGCEKMGTNSTSFQGSRGVIVAEGSDSVHGGFPNLPPKMTRREAQALAMRIHNKMKIVKE